jgi:hypothetical protein
LGLWAGSVSGAVAERDSQADFHVPASDAYLFDHESEEALAPVEVEVVDAGGDSCGEVGYTPAELVVDRELLLAGEELGAFVLHTGLAGGDVFAAAAQLVQVDQPRLVEIGEATTLAVDLLSAAADTLELGGAELVVGDFGFAGQCRFAGHEQFGP